MFGLVSIGHPFNIVLSELFIAGSAFVASWSLAIVLEGIKNSLKGLMISMHSDPFPI